MLKVQLAGMVVENLVEVGIVMSVAAYLQMIAIMGGKNISYTSDKTQYFG